MTIFIKDLTFDAIIGILDFERNEHQSITYNVEIDYAGEFIDYAAVREVLIKKTKYEQFFLLEDALAFFSTHLKGLFPQMQRLKIRLHKNNIFGDCIVGVEEEYKFSN